MSRSAAKIALQADLCYNVDLKSLASAMLQTSARLRQTLLGGSSMDSLYPHAQDGNLIPLKHCTGPCGRTLPATSEYFHRETRSKDGFRAACKQCRSVFLDGRREQKKLYDLKYYYEHRQQSSETSKRYRQTERGIIAKRARAHNRRARKRNAAGTHTTEELSQQFQRQKGKCYYCHKKLGKGRSSWNGDHIVPLSKGGTNYIDNIVIVCPTCNFRKGTKLPHEWPEGGRLL